MKLKGLLKRVDDIREMLWFLRGDKKNNRVRGKWNYEMGEEYPCLKVELSLRLVSSDPDTKITKFRDTVNEYCYVFRPCPRSYEMGRNYEFMYKFRIRDYDESQK